MAKNNSLEKDVQDRFFDILIQQQKAYENTKLAVYQNLVYNRYEEVIKNSFPIFIEYLSHESLEKSILAFMKETPTTPFVWQIANDYRKFVKKQKFFHDRKFLYELLYYDWIEIELSMAQYKNKKQKNFSYKQSYKLSKSARIKRFKYDIINGNYDEKNENFLVIYYDFETDEVVYRQINQLIYEVFKKLNSKQTISKILKEICEENDIDFKEAKKLLDSAFKELLYNKVLF